FRERDTRQSLLRAVRGRPKGSVVGRCPAVQPRRAAGRTGGWTLTLVLRRCAYLAIAGFAAALAGCSQAPPTPTAAPAVATTAPPAASPTAPAAAKPAASPSPSVTAASPVAAPSPAVKPAASPAASPAVAAAASPTPLSVAQLSAIQPGLGTVMIGSAGRIGREQ